MDDTRIIKTNYSQVEDYPYSAPAILIPPGAPLLFIQGQVPWDDELNVVSQGDFKGQVRQVFRNLEAICVDAGGKLSDLVHTLIFLTDMDRFDPEFLDVRTEFFPTADRPGYSPPAAVVEVTRLALEPVMVEIHAVAALTSVTEGGTA